MKIKKNLFRRLPIALRLVLLTLISFSAASAVDIDVSFQAYLSKLGQGAVYQSVIQPDGKIIVTGNFTMVQGRSRSTIARLNQDGSLDTTFNPPASITGHNDQMIAAVELQSDGKIVIGGRFFNLGGIIRHGLARLNTDGSVDQSFNPPPGLADPIVVYDVEIYPDDRILISGLRNYNVYTIMRLNANGTLIQEANIAATRLEIQPNGKILYNGNGLRRLNADLTPDNTFTPVTPNQGIAAIKTQADGKILFGGSFSQINGTPVRGFGRANPDGGVDAAFTINSNNSTIFSVSSIVIRPDGKILVGGTKLELRNPDGTVDASFNPPAINPVYDIDLQPDGRIVVSGAMAQTATSMAVSVVRLNADGTLDPTFQATVGGYGTGSKVQVLPDNKFFVTGDFNYTGGVVRRYFAKFNADGTVDTTFNPPAYTNPVDFEVFPDGKVLVRQFGGSISKLSQDGTPEFTITGGGIKALPDGRFLVSGNNQLIRYNANGTLDPTFVVQTNETIYAVAVQPDGKVIIGGNFTLVNSTARSKIARINTDGTLDASFPGPVGGINGAVFEVVLQPDGKILLQGTFNGISFEPRFTLARLNADGSLDTSFFVPTQSDPGKNIKLQPDGKILVTGGFSYSVRRLNPNGSADTSFNPPALTRQVENTPVAVSDIDIQTDGKIIIVGSFIGVNGVFAPGIARLVETTKTLFDYDGDGKADISVFRPSENKWYVLRSSDGQVTQQIFAINGDVPVPADYDGDGKTDFAIFRPSSADWWSLSSRSGQQVFADWGQTGDIPRPSDFDGDGRVDYVAFRPSNSTWYRISSQVGGAVSNRGFGLAGDKPVTGDFDGDGKSDVAIYRPSTGDWWWQSSIDGGQRATHWGISTDIPAPADYDGDGKTDFAVYRPSNGTWYVYNSSNNSSTILNFGLSEDKPVPADYDGDGKADIAVFRPSTGVWYLMRSSQGFAAVQFGISTDIPTPNAFVP